MATGYPEGLAIAPGDWPPKDSGPKPGDLQNFLPQGFGLGAPPIITPYGGPGGDYYDFDTPQTHPILDGPTTESRGGTLYFDDQTEPDALVTALNLMGVYRGKDYVAFAAGSADPKKDRYLDQLRLMSKTAATTFFSAPDGKTLPDQPLDYVDAILAFVEAQKAKWDEQGLDGLMGGDGDWAKERLAFGFHVENTYWAVYRVWSRAWLITK